MARRLATAVHQVSASGKSTSRFFAEIGEFDEIKIGKLDGNSGNLTTFFMIN